ncbi:caspase domain-containing protein [Streptomyces sp. NPDC008313]|uniref:caspase family protein n=1 Tax=Streptomyces sp. NPDC008313 TaxID=3364826 RepID=UPI0036ED9EEE
MDSGARKALLVSTDEYADSFFHRLRAPGADSQGLTEVLRDEEIGDFTVQPLHNSRASEVNLAIEDFFTESSVDDTLVFYLSGHGVKDLSGRLHFAMTDSRRDRLGSTALASSFLYEQLMRSRSRRKLVILDCCYAGAFPFAAEERLYLEAAAPAFLGGRGTAIIASSASIEYSFEKTDLPGSGDDASSSRGPGVTSIFTECLISGIRTGAADLGRDGLIDAAELYDYVYREVKSRLPEQTPTFSSRLEGKLVIARSRHGQAPPLPDTTATAPEELRITMDADGTMNVSLGRRSVLFGAAGLLVRPSARTTADETRSWDVQLVHRYDQGVDFARHIEQRWPGTQVSNYQAGDSFDFHVSFPGGRTFCGASSEMRVYSESVARADGVHVIVPRAGHAREFLRRPQPSYVVGACRDEAGERFFVLSKEAARQQLRRQRDEGRARVFVPAANEVDDFVYGVLWAVHNLDSALLEDDRLLAQTKVDLSQYQSLRSSSASTDLITELNPVSRAWLGSDFCADYITANLASDPRPPSFWTREQTGEEACLWLFVAHKFEYLKQTSQLDGDPSVRSSRAFCIPEDVVRKARPHESILLFLAAALMEAFGIDALVATDARLSDVEGFVLIPGNRALIANWVRSEGIWHVDTKSGTRALTSFSDPLGEAARSMLQRQGGSLQRLLALADYLGIDWAWLKDRCRRLAEAGPAGVVHPRSRLVSLDGLTAACRFIAFGEEPPRD